jgi:cephalosporin hydroxylase
MHKILCARVYYEIQIQKGRKIKRGRITVNEGAKISVLKQLLRLTKNEVETLRRCIHHRFYINPRLKKSVINGFHKLYYDEIATETWHNTFWLGIHTAKCPLDLWVLQEAIFKVKPDIIIETGTGNGGSALFLASMCDLVNNGKVLTIDIEAKEGRPEHKRITYLVGSSTSQQIVHEVRSLIKDGDKVMVDLDSDHTEEHVLNELRIYSKLVTKGSYIIVEDTNLNGNPVYPDFGPGPMEAVQAFLKENKDFVVDKSKEKFLLTFNPKGYLIRIR